MGIVSEVHLIEIAEIADACKKMDNQLSAGYHRDTWAGVPPTPSKKILEGFHVIKKKMLKLLK